MKFKSFLTFLLIAAVNLTAVSVTKGKKKAHGRKAVKTTQTAPPAKPQQWALINVAAACLRTEPAHSSQLETQASYGTPAKVTEQRGEWYRLELPDGYKAWMIGSSLVPKSEEQLKAWRQTPRLIVTQPRPCSAYSDSSNISEGNIAFDIVIGSIFEGEKTPGSRFAKISLPDGRSGFVKSADVADFSKWSKQKPDIDTIMNTARSMMGVTYLWGGTTPKAIDCSGFTKVCFGAAGLILPRNASQQASIGETLDINNPDAYRRGDLLFFGTGNGTNVTHVGIYDGFTRFIHASGRVFESSFKASHPLYLPRKVIGACRILDTENTNGFTTYASHPWYF